MAVTISARRQVFSAYNGPLEQFRLCSSTSEKSDESSVQVDSNDPFQEYRNKNNMKDQVFSAISKDGQVKVTACTARNIINEMMIQHTMTATPADALGRAAICALLMSNGMQDEQTVQLTLNGKKGNFYSFLAMLYFAVDVIICIAFLLANGPLRGLVAISSALGEVRGYVGSPMLGDMHISEAIGKGMVQVVKNHPSWPNPYNGITAIQHGDVDRDIGTFMFWTMLVSCSMD